MSDNTWELVGLLTCGLIVAVLHASLRDDVSCEVDAMNISHAADRCDEREDR